MRLRFTARALVVGDRAGTVVPDAVLDVGGRADRLARAGRRGAARRTTPSACELPGILTPGLVNTHSHAPMVLFRGQGEGLPLDRWLREVMWPREARLTPEDVEVAMTAASAEMLGNGITTSVEMYFHPERIAAAVGTTGARAVIPAPLVPLPGMGTLDEQLQTRRRPGRGRAGRRQRRVRRRAARRLHGAAARAAGRRPSGARARAPAAPARRGDRAGGRRPARRARAVGAGPAGGERRPGRAGAGRALRAPGRRRPGAVAGARRRRRPLPGQQRQAGQRDRAAAGDARPGHPGGHGHRRAGVQRRAGPLRRPPAGRPARPAGRAARPRR